MYTQYYGFSEKPFDITPDPRFLYLSLSHREALASLVYGIRERRGFIAVLGEAGTGKTTLLRSALDHLKEDVKVAHILNTDVTFPEILQMVLTDLDLAGRKEQLSKVEAFNRLNHLAIQQLSAGGNMVIMVDEAQNLDRNCLENLRLLSNLETRKHKLIQIVLSGQPELEGKLRRPDLRQLSQRINLRRYILPLSEKETSEYIDQRLKVVRYAGPPLFTKKAERLLWQESGGIPRIINTLCDNALLIAFALKQPRIQEETVREAVDDLTRDRYQKGAEPQPSALPGPATLPVTGPAKRRAGVFQLILLISCISLFAGAGLGILGTHWKTKDSSAFQKTARAVISNFQENPSDSSILPSEPQQPPTVIPPLENTPELNIHPSSSQTALVFLNEQIGPPPAREHEPNASGQNASERPVEEAESITVREGDSLHRIIVRHYGRYNKALEQKVLEANPFIEDPNRIFVTQRIKIPDISNPGTLN
jgi:general secretion pathway protein A